MIELYASARARDFRDRERSCPGMDILDIFLFLCECLRDSWTYTCPRDTVHQRLFYLNIPQAVANFGKFFPTERLRSRGTFEFPNRLILTPRLSSMHILDFTSPHLDISRAACCTFKAPPSECLTSCCTFKISNFQIFLELVHSQDLSLPIVPQAAGHSGLLSCKRLAAC
jgi:hypothetical protein